MLDTGLPSRHLLSVELRNRAAGTQTRLDVQIRFRQLLALAYHVL